MSCIYDEPLEPYYCEADWNCKDCPNWIEEDKKTGTREQAIIRLNRISNRLSKYCDVNDCIHGNCAKCYDALNIAIEALEQEPKRGKWIAIDDTHSQCTECGAIFCITSSDDWEVNYCPNCGTRMESDEE